MIPFLIEAFTYNKQIWPDIDKLYQSNKYEFYRAAKESKYYNHKLLLEGDIYKQEYGRKILGILTYLEKTKSEELNKELIKMTEKGWLHIHKYVGNNEKIVFEDYVKKFIKPEMPVNKINTELTMLYTIAHVKGKEIANTEAYRSYVESIVNRAQNYEAVKEKLFDNLPNEVKEMAKQLRKRIEEKYKKIGNFDEIYDNSMLREEADTYALIADTEQLNLTDLFENIKFTKKDILELLGIYYITYKNLNAENAVKFLVPAVIIKSLLKAYNGVKEHYFQNNKETMFLEVQKQEDLIKKIRRRKCSIKGKNKKFRTPN